MLWPDRLHAATFIGRDNRFRARVLVDGAAVAAHVPNSGRLTELFRPGAVVWVRMAVRAASRKTACDLALVEHAGTLVSVDARLPNRLVAEALAQGRLPTFRSFASVRPEARLGHSRLDFLLEGTDDRCWLETKSVTLVEDGVALFPDAPTDRGTRHLRELAARAALGERAAVLFVVQRSDVAAFAPHPTADPVFADALHHAAASGVEFYARRCRVSLAGITLTEALPVRL